MKRLELFFENEEGRSVKYTLDDPIEPVDEAAVREVMNEIVEQDVFHTTGGGIVALRRARVVEQTVEEIAIDE